MTIEEYLRRNKGKTKWENIGGGSRRGRRVVDGGKGIKATPISNVRTPGDYTKNIGNGRNVMDSRNADTQRPETQSIRRTRTPQEKSMDRAALKVNDRQQRGLGPDKRIVNAVERTGSGNSKRATLSAAPSTRSRAVNKNSRETTEAALREGQRNTSQTRRPTPVNKNSRKDLESAYIAEQEKEKKRKKAAQFARLQSNLNDPSKRPTVKTRATYKRGAGPVKP